jgi:ferrochelatase
LSNKKIGVVLFQLGGPDSLDAIEPFLYNLFCDPDIIDFPLAKMARPVLAKFISKGRSRKVRDHYAEIGGGSPIRRITEQQAAALEAELRADLDARVFVAMRYWHPFSSETIEQVRLAGCDELVLLPLYPQYSSTTTGSSLNEWKRRCRAAGLDIPSRVIDEYHDFEPYIDSLVKRINETLARFERPENAHLVFSAHSVPESVILGGDPYRDQIEATVRHVRSRGGWPNAATVCFQSKVGSRKWLQPTLHQTNGELGRQGVRDMLVVPIAFVSDHVETLSEIDIEGREEAIEHGVERFEMMPGLNDDPAFIGALAGLVRRTLGAAADMAQAGGGVRHV